MKNPALTVVDLFAGAGGLSSSLEAVGWRSVAAVDIDADAIETLRLNQARGHLAGSKLIQTDIREISAKDLRPANSTPRWRPDLLAGGPPCQPFSSAGAMKGLGDPRGRLFQDFVRLADELKPRFILFENVAGLVTAKAPSGRPGGVLQRIQREFEAIGYACRFDLLNAADFGAPQRRVRLYMIACRNERLPCFPEPTHSRAASLDRLQWETLGDFLSTQPRPSPTDIVRPSPRRVAELAALTPGTGLRSNGIVEANRPSGHWGYRQDCFVADPSLPSRTIRAASTPDWLRRQGEDIRRLTWRECAGLQGFLPDWEFAGTTSSRFRQIGNAVQGHIGRAIGEKLHEAAETRQRARVVSAEWPASFLKRVRYTAMEEAVNGAHRRAARERHNVVPSSQMV
ncbi:DNA cytosine methyltransferase [Bradyrhizobium diazoefficiens]|nr:DNA cytosine methyltransferase [Bradyrhizobium diazoefficiens]